LRPLSSQQQRILQQNFVVDNEKEFSMSCARDVSDSSECATAPTSEALSFDVDHDGDSERKANNTGKRTGEGRKERNDIDVSCNNNLKSVAVGASRTTLAIHEPADNYKSSNTPEIPTPISVSTFNSSISSALSSSKQSRTRSFSAAVQVSSLQASFAERTSLEMQEIVGWYEITATEERFTKVDQRQCLPNNAMVCDLEDDDDEVDSTELNGGGTSSGPLNDRDAILIPLPATPRRRHTSHHKPYRASEVRKHLEASDHLIRNTQYMAEVVAELNHSSSTSSNESNDLSWTISMSSPQRSNEEIVEDPSKYKDDVLFDSTLLTRSNNNNNDSPQRLQRSPSVVQENKPTGSPLASLAIPVGVAVLLGALWRTRLVEDGQ
jgi:hypothetical protein